MKNKVLVLFVILLSLTACQKYGVRGNGNLTTETRSIENFTAIEAGGIFRVYVEIGESASLKIEAEENLMGFIKAKVKGSTLVLDLKKNINPKEHVTVYVTTPDLERVESSGASKIYVENIDSDYFKLDLSGAGKVKLVGKTDRFIADISGAANLDAFDLKCEDVDIDMSGASKAEIYCDGILKTDISGVGKVVYDGNPKNVYSEISGLGKITSR